MVSQHHKNFVFIIDHLVERRTIFSVLKARYFSLGGRNRSRRQDSRAEASSGCNTPDPMSPGTANDLPEIMTRPSTPINDDSNASNNSLAASIRLVKGCILQIERKLNA